MMKEKKWIAILAFHRTGSHAAVDLILTQQEHDEGGDDGDDDTGADVVVLVAHACSICPAARLPICRRCR